jgi:hypothetical protein
MIRDTKEPALSLHSLMLLMLAIRMAANLALGQGLGDGGAAYSQINYTLATHMAHGEWPVDALGLHAFHGIAYPALLAPFFALLGAGQGVALGVNLGLALVSALLVVGIARAAGLGAGAQKLALMGYALWLPGIWSGSLLSSDNLATPLLLMLVWCSLKLLYGPRVSVALLAGMAWGGAMLTGASLAALIVAPMLGLLLAWEGRWFKPALALGLGGAMVMAPWGWATQSMLGAPVLSSQTGFNLYIGNNPSATGGYLSIAQTPVAPQWQAMRAQQGELGATDALAGQALRWMAEHPREAARLFAHKLALFWSPNLPDAQDLAASRALGMVRMIEVGQYVFLLGMAAAGLMMPGGMAWRGRAMMLGSLGALWLAHALGYITAHDRDPIMPLIIVLAAAALAELGAQPTNNPTPKPAIA